MLEFNDMQQLIDILNEHTRLYDEGHPIISDAEWDEMYFTLQQMEKDTGTIYPNSPTQKISYEIVSSLNKIEHNHSMLSLDKTKDWNEFLQYFGDKSVVGMCKLDGLTCCLTYEDGKLVSAETRGNGIIGEDILHNAKTIKNIPQTIQYKDTFIVDGEMICTYQNFAPFSEEYKNPRNFASGSIRLLNNEECSKRNLSFIVWNVVKGGSNPHPTVINNLLFAESLGFDVVPWTSSFDWDAKEFLIEQAKNFGYPIDGLVGRFNDIEYGNSLGETEHHSRSAYAFKFYDEEYETTLKDIEWTMGRIGTLTPVAIFEPIDTGDSIVERASLHNISVMHELLGDSPFNGLKIKVVKQNMIIPQVVWSEKDNCEINFENLLKLPTKCPVCGGEVKSIESDSGTINLVCLNPQCSGKLINQLDYFVGKKGLDVKGLSIATLEKLIDLGWLNNIADIFTLKKHRKDWILLDGFGAKSVDKILLNIELAKDVNLSTFICSLGIPLIGSSQSKTLAKECLTWNEFRKRVDEKYNFSKLANFGEAKTSAILNYNYELADKIACLFPVINMVETTIEPIIDENNKCNGLTFVITGMVKKYKNRDELSKVIEELGGKVTNSVTKNTNYLITNDSTSGSSKNVAAKKYNIPIINEEEFQEKFLK